MNKVKVFILLAGALLVGCNERFRYPCQNPDNFHKLECTKPKCQFTQQCPEYLVAPILEKQIEPAKSTAATAGQP